MARRHAPENPAYNPRWAEIIAAAGAPAPLVYTPPKRRFLSVIYADRALIALDKPALLLAVPGKPAGHQDCLESRAQGAFPDARIVHRLDRPTSGVMALARTPEAHRRLGLQFERRTIRKTYIARVAGVIEQAEGVVDAPICGDWPRRPRQMVHFEHGKPAETRWRVMSRGRETTRVELRPTTGRTHQLRLHMAWIGHPILGDEFYAPPAARAAADRLQLHAWRLELRHPDTGDDLWLETACPF